MAWYTNSYRRHLADMHIEDWSREFLSQFSPEDYFENLKIAHIQSPMIYLQSHVGYCYWPTASGKMHSAFKGKENEIKRLVDLCRNDGMNVVGYYSLIYNTWAEDNHPEWRMRNAEGLSLRQRISGHRYGLCCPNNAEYREFVFTQISEISEYFMLDGMFYDMLFWPDICYCPSCRKRWKEEADGDMPEKEDWNDERWLLFIKKRCEWMGEFASTVTNETKRLMPGITVEHNYACGVAGGWENGSTELVNEACDYTGGDLYGDLYNHSFTAKYYKNVTKNQPFEYMTCRCDNNLQKHTITKSKRHLSLEVLLTCAHHGASFIIDAVDPVGTLDRRVYEKIGKVFDKQMLYEPYFNGEMIEDVGVFYSSMGRYNPGGENYTSKTASVNAVRTLIEKNIPVGVLSNGSAGNLSAYKAIIVPAAAGLFEKSRKALIDYVYGGGKLYISGSGDKELVDLLTGAEITGITESNRTYIAPEPGYEELFGEFNEKYPLPADYKQGIIKADGNEGILARIVLPYTVPGEYKFASIHSNPPGKLTEYPSIIVKSYGKGKVIWSAAPIENETIPQYKNIFVKLIKMLTGGDYTVSSDAPAGVEIVSFRTDNGVRVSVVDMLSADEDICKGDFEIGISYGKASQVSLIPSGASMKYYFKDGKTVVKIDKLSQFMMFEVFI